MRLLTECESTCCFMVDHVTHLSKTEATPQPWWKFAVKACYIRIVILASCMEFATPKALIENFVAEMITKLVEHFFKDQDSTQNFYIIQNRRMYAKLRRLGYFVPECEELYKRLVFDQLNIYEGMYDFTTFQVENPIIEEVDTPSLEPVVDDREPRIYEVEV
jgi:hypothetical protein